jgi:hypothetical protein
MNLATPALFERAYLPIIAGWLAASGDVSKPE